MFKDECNRDIVDKKYSNERCFHIYIWYAKTTPRKIFYVGKGTSKRYKYILTDIQNYIKCKSLGENSSGLFS